MPLKLRRPSKRVLIVLCLFLAALIAFAVLELTNTTHVFHHKQTPVVAGTSFATKGEKKSSPGASSAPSSQKNSTTNSVNSKVPANSVLFEPSGSFVSNHHPNLSGSPAPNTIASVCNTTPGASCKITFAKDSEVKELPSRVADANGSAYWNWKLQDIGLTAGTWKIKAVSTLNGQNKSSYDAMDMVVQP